MLPSDWDAVRAIYEQGLATGDASFETEAPGAGSFDRAYRDFLQRYLKTGATTADLVATFRRADPRSERVFTDWLLTPSWYGRLTAGVSLSRLIEDYRRR